MKPLELGKLARELVKTHIAGGDTRVRLGSHSTRCSARVRHGSVGYAKWWP
jgi:hypothetical protein